MEYRRRKTSDTWHWCTNCSQWPTSNYESVNLPAGKRPSGDLDNECRKEERDGTCTTTG
jgi:hypothetical protein